MADEEQQHASEPIGRARSDSVDRGRVNQKLRTRQALVDSARELVAAGANPTLAEVAEHALVSKTTAYRYFPSAEALITEVFFDREFPTTDGALGAAGDEPIDRVLAVEQAVNDALLANETAMRVIIRNALDMALASGDSALHRIGRRQALIATALEPLGATLEPEQLELLRNALTLAIGPEAVIATRDVCQLSAEDARRVTRWATEALVAHALRPT